MRERNPFLIRTAERISNEDEFIKLFSPKIIEIIKENLEGYSLWNQFFRFQSSPGGGKTSLLKLFSPTVLIRLKQIFKSRTEANTDIDSLFSNLKLLGAFNDLDEVNVLSVYISCASDYDNISNLNLSKPRKNRLFVSLINVRILISFIRTFLEYLKILDPDLDLEEELKKLTIIPRSNISLPTDFPIECNGHKLYEWSGKLEKAIYRQIDGFESEIEDLNEHSGLFSVQLLTSEQLYYKGELSIPTNIAIFFDDIQKLAFEQYNYISNEIVEKRPSNGIWFAERLDLFNLDDLWSKNASTNGRDYVKEVNLEELLKGRSNFKDFSINVAEKRVERSKDVSLSSFPSILLDDLNYKKNDIEILINKVIENINDSSKMSSSYKSVLNEIINKSFNGEFEKLIELRIFQILIERMEKKKNREPSLFDTEYLISEYELDKKRFSKNDSLYLLSRDLKIPYYFGYNTLVSLSSSNIEQFLAFAGRLFENVISANIIGKDNRITPYEQEKILLKEANRRWKDLNSLSNYKEIKTLLDSIAKFCNSQDNILGYSYRGVTGFALKLEDRQRLTNQETWVNSPHYRVLSRVLTVAIANNLLEVRLDKKQGNKGEPPKTLFFLNRWVCLKYGLSFSYTGWRTVNLDILGKWVYRGFKEKDTENITSQMKNLYD